VSVTLSTHEQIAAAYKTLLGAIAADDANYNYTPSQVVRVRWWNRQWLSPERKPLLIFIRPGQELHREHATEQWRAEMEVFLLVCSYDSRGSNNDPFKESGQEIESGWQVENKAVRDVLKKLIVDPTLGGLAENIVEGSLIVDRAQFVDGWDVTEIRFVTSYTYHKSAP
jgi:hypothetical protein